MAIVKVEEIEREKCCTKKILTDSELISLDLVCMYRDSFRLQAIDNVQHQFYVFVPYLIIFHLLS